MAVQKCLHRQLQPQLKSGDTFDLEVVDHLRVVELEAVGGVMRGYAAKPMQRQATGARHQLLEGRSANQLAARHVPAAADQVVSLEIELVHLVDSRHLI